MKNIIYSKCRQKRDSNYSRELVTWYLCKEVNGYSIWREWEVEESGECMESDRYLVSFITGSKFKAIELAIEYSKNDTQFKTGPINFTLE